MQRSNSYIIMYTIALTLVCAVVLALASEGLKPTQKANIDLEKKKFILQSFMGSEKVKSLQKPDIENIYKTRVKGIILKTNGEEVSGVAEAVDVAKEYKKPEADRQLPFYIISSESDPSKTEFYVMPIYGFGLWDNIWGYVAVKGDMNTISGVVFDHKGETPGLGARITTAEIQERYVGKQLFSGKDFKSVKMQKGEGNNYDTDPHSVDGMSGATLTANGINNMMNAYLGAYSNYFSKLSSPSLTLNNN